MSVCQNEKCQNATEPCCRKWQGFLKYCSDECRNLARSKSQQGKHVSTETISKRKATHMEKYGVENPMQLQSTKDKIKETNIERYGVEHQMHRDEIKDKIKETNIERYGVVNPSQAECVKDKKAATSMANHGVDNPFKSPAIQKKARDTMLRKYGVNHCGHIAIGPDVLAKITSEDWLTEFMIGNTVLDLMRELNISRWVAFKYLKMYKLITISKSYFEDEMAEFLTSIGATFKERSRSHITPLELDFVIDDKFAIECNGVYWHSELAGNKDRKYHLNKTTMCNDIGIQLIHVSEDEWLTNTDLVKSRIKAKLGANKRVYARKCIVKPIVSMAANAFINDNHIQGNCPASIRYGIFESENLIGVMTFGKSRYNKKYEYELLRYCTKQGVNIVGGAGKLFKQFTRDYDSLSVISYSDKAWNNGGVYEAIGFTYSHTSAPSYKYTKNFILFENRVAYQKHKLADKLDVFDPNLSEWQNMQVNGYDRIWDCGNDVYTFNG